MAVNKVVLGSETLLDLTGDTVTKGHPAGRAERPQCGRGTDRGRIYAPGCVHRGQCRGRGHIRPGSATRCRGRKEVPVRRWQLGHTRSADND